MYRKYRPQNFASLIGQKSAVEVLTNSIAKNKIGHAYLFSGSRGCGKTSSARIFAKALNCLNPQGYEPCCECKNCIDITAGESLDVIEIDGASNNGVENIRGLKENVALTPFNSKYKIYIIDEVHMLSGGAFNALLKTLEEPPEYVIFILATTEPHKVPVTIRSRCQHIPFHSITPEDIYSRLEFVCNSENVNFESEALYEISRQADGALRDALSLLEQVIASGDITLHNVESVFGVGSRPAFERWVKNLRQDKGEAYVALKNMFEAGASGVRIFEEMFSIVRNLWLASKWKGIIDNLGLSNSEKKFLRDEVNNWKPDNLHNLLNNILRSLTQARQGMRNDILLGSFMLSLESQPEPQSSQIITQKQQPSIEIPGVEQFEVTLILPQSMQQKQQAPNKPNENINFDPSLKENLLTISHSGDFKIYCALFDSRPIIENNNLILDFEHRYCYEILRVGKTAASIKSMFTDYEEVILRYGTDETKCPSFTQPKQTEINNTSMTTTFNKTEIYEPSEITEIPTHTKTSSIFDKYKHEITNLTKNSEVILIKKFETEENDNDNDNNDNNEDDNENE